MDDKESKVTEESMEDEGASNAERLTTEGPFQSELEKLRLSLDAKDTEIKKNYDLYLRQVAETENFKKRTAREKAEAIRFSNESFVRDILPVLDNLERAVEHAKVEENGKSLLDGVELVLKSFLEVLEKYGVKQICAKGEPFDPQKHEAFAQVESKNHEPNTVVEELHKGYAILDRLLRPALVSVSKLPEIKEVIDEQEKVENGSGDD